MAFFMRARRVVRWSVVEITREDVCWRRSGSGRVKGGVVEVIREVMVSVTSLREVAVSRRRRQYFER
jgi:hypothetical protein